MIGKLDLLDGPEKSWALIIYWKGLTIFRFFFNFASCVLSSIIQVHEINYSIKLYCINYEFNVGQDQSLYLIRRFQVQNWNCFLKKLSVFNFERSGILRRENHRNCILPPPIKQFIGLYLNGITIFCFRSFRKFIIRKEDKYKWTFMIGEVFVNH